MESTLKSANTAVLSSSRRKQTNRKKKHQGHVKVALFIRPKSLEMCTLHLNSLLPPLKTDKRTNLSVQTPSLNELASSFSERKKLLSEESHRFFLQARRSLVKEVFGTQEPTVKVKSELLYLSTSASVLNVLVYAISYNNIHDYGQWASLFDEYKLIRGHSHFLSLISSFSTATADEIYQPALVGVIDYDDSGILPNMDAGNIYDTSRMVPFCQKVNKIESWEWVSQGTPDLNWTSTAVDYSVGWFKWFFNGLGAISINPTSMVWHDYEVEFRQLVA